MGPRVAQRIRPVVKVFQPVDFRFKVPLNQVGVAPVHLH